MELISLLIFVNVFADIQKMSIALNKVCVTVYFIPAAEVPNAIPQFMTHFLIFDLR